MVDRIVRAIRLDWTVFREIAEDQNAMSQAAIIVAVVTFMSAVGSGIASRSLPGFFVDWILAILVGWIGWAIITFLVGTIVFKGQTDVPEMMRVLGYASAPKLLGIFGFIFCVGPIITLAGWVLALIAGVLAIREAMDFDTESAIVTVIIGWLIAFSIRVALWFVIG